MELLVSLAQVVEVKEISFGGKRTNGADQKAINVAIKIFQSSQISNNPSTNSKQSLFSSVRSLHTINPIRSLSLFARQIQITLLPLIFSLYRFRVSVGDNGGCSRESGRWKSRKRR
ncbi:hypothetical protein L1987_36020 [Smallanthus sonchifolius]|uniref:Uncharacterized protein n=1 Tax=Smallanthus sonchifolius TaxID=185202 RepID=A0ACB9HD17_9ASTR|nr:hypothetical protein L1987_36020 [Smallanthus sonchifolius]